MSFFTNMRADRLITEIRSASGPMDPAAQKAAAKLKELGPSAIEAVFAALPEADRNTTLTFVDILQSLAGPKTFPQFVQGLIETEK